MASNNIARLGVVLGMDTAEFTAAVDKAIAANKQFKREIQRDSNAAVKEWGAIKFATEDYGKTLTKVELIERELSAGRLKYAAPEVAAKLRDQAAAYDAVAAAAEKAAQSERIAADIQSITHATEDYGKTLSRVQTIEREIASGRYQNATQEQRQSLLNAAAGYDAIAESAQKAAQSQKVAADIQQLKFATQDYGKTLTEVQKTEREIATGKYRTASNTEQASLLSTAAAYDAVAAAAKKADQAKKIADDINQLTFATQNYGKTLSRVQIVENEIAVGKYRDSTQSQQASLLATAAAYDAVAIAAQKASQSAAIKQDIHELNLATQTYGQTLSKVQLTLREIYDGKYKTATAQEQQSLLNAASAYDRVAEAAKKAAQSQQIAADIHQLNLATQDYGKSLTKVEAIEREIATGKYRTATQDEVASLRKHAAAYDAVAAAAQKAAQAQNIADDIQRLNFATQDYGKTLSRVQAIEREIATGKYRTASPEQRQALLNAAAAYDSVSGSVRRVNAGLTEQQKMGISYQITDFVTQVGSGQNAMVALLQQGGQLKDQLGGFSNAFALLKTAITPVGIALTAIAGTVGILGLAFYKGAQESAALRDSLILTGRYAGITQSGFQQLAESLSGSLNYSIGNTKDILSELVSSGKFTSDSLGSVGQSIALVAKLSGQSASEVAQKLIPSFNGTASSAKSMNDQYHFLTLAQYKQIEALEKQGRAQEAIKLQADAFNASVKDQTRNLGIIEESWKALGNAISRAWEFLKGIGRTDGPEIQLQNVVKQINALEQGGLAAAQKAAAMRGDNSFVEKFQKDLQDLYNKKNQLTAEIVAEADKTKTKTDEAKANANAISLYEKAGGLSAQRKLEDEFNKISFANKIEIAKQEATEIGAIQLESQKKIEEARKEMLQANRDQNNQFSLLQLQIFKQKEIAIITETTAKIKGIQTKANQDAAQADLSYLEDVNAFMAARQTAFDNALLSQTRAIELENLSLEFANKKLIAQDSLRFASEKEVKLSELRLKTEERIAQIQLDKNLDEKGKQSMIDQVTQQQNIKSALIETEDRYKKVGEMWDSVTNNMTNALDNFVKTGKLNFKDFARSVIQDLIAIQLKAQATSLLRMAINSFTGASFGTGSGYGSQDYGGFLDTTSLTKRAEGGPLESNQLSMVGERGPELFVPRTAGTIIPNHALAGMGGSTTNVVNNYIQAIDTQSFEQRLLGSSRAIWAANAYAAKGLASTMGRA